MRKTLLLLIPFFWGCSLQAQSVVGAKDSLYIVTYTVGEAWDKAKGPGEQMYFKEHSARLGQLRKGGVIKFGARYADKGIIVITAPTLTAAKDIVGKDIAVANKLFNADVQKLGIFYEGCLEQMK